MEKIEITDDDIGRMIEVDIDAAKEGSGVIELPIEYAKRCAVLLRRPDTSAELEGLLDKLIMFSQREGDARNDTAFRRKGLTSLRECQSKIHDLFKRHEGRG